MMMEKNFEQLHRTDLIIFIKLYASENLFIAHQQPTKTLKQAKNDQILTTTEKDWKNILYAVSMYLSLSSYQYFDIMQ